MTTQVDVQQRLMMWLLAYNYKMAGEEDLSNKMYLVLILKFFLLNCHCGDLVAFQGYERLNFLLILLGLGSCIWTARIILSSCHFFLIIKVLTLYMQCEYRNQSRCPKSIKWWILHIPSLSFGIGVCILNLNRRLFSITRYFDGELE